jgi:hypothetical protein
MVLEKLFISRCRAILVSVYDDRIFKRGSIVFEICPFVIMIFVIMRNTDTIPGMARSGVSMTYFSPRYRKKDQKNVQRFREGGGDNLARGVGMQIYYREL